MAKNQRQLCNCFLKGFCPFGSNCFNLHVRNNKTQNSCQYYFDKCPCVNGINCRYQRGKPKLNNNNAVSSNNATNNILKNNLSQSPDNSNILSESTNKLESLESNEEILKNNSSNNINNDKPIEKTKRILDKTCAICMEIVWDEDKTDQCFGILKTCNHILCLPCMRE